MPFYAVNEHPKRGMSKSLNGQTRCVEVNEGKLSIDTKNKE